MVNDKFEPCTFIEVKSDGRLIMNVDGKTLSAALQQAVIPPGKTEVANDFLNQRAPRVMLRCELNVAKPKQVINIEYLAWRDKTGDVWQDLGQELINQCLAKPKKFNAD